MVKCPIDLEFCVGSSRKDIQLLENRLKGIRGRNLTRRILRHETPRLRLLYNKEKERINRRWKCRRWRAFARTVSGAWKIVLASMPRGEPSVIATTTCVDRYRDGRPPRFVLQPEEGYQAQIQREKRQSGQSRGWWKRGDGWPVGSTSPTRARCSDWRRPRTRRKRAKCRRREGWTERCLG